MKRSAIPLLLLPILSFGQSNLQDITAWAYQLQNIDIQTITDNATFALVVIDYSADGSEEAQYSADQIAQIKNSGKKTIAYISIGEAEDYRFYWQAYWDADRDGIPDPGAPDWLGWENPGWEGNYKVRFWQTGWQNIVFSYIDRIISQGFDGIYCDIIDAYYYWSEENGEKPDADALMVQFVKNIRDHIISMTTDPFYIIPQNGEFIIVEDDVTETLKLDFFEAIDGIGIEDIFFIGEYEENNPYIPSTERIDILKEYLSAGIPVFSVEYLTEPGLIQQYKTAASSEGYIPYVARRELDTLNDGIATHVSSPAAGSPIYIHLVQNFPNPFNDGTTILVTLPEPASVRVCIVNAAGAVVHTLINERRLGSHTLSWDGRDQFGKPLPSGVYTLVVQSSDCSQSQQKILMTK